MIVSVIVPVYNGEKYLEGCINSIRNQSYKKLEIIIINDGSSDNTHQIAEKLERDDSRICYIQQKNKGVSYTRNKGIEAAKGEYITFVDCDDTIEKDYIKALFNSINDKNLDVVACGYNDISMYGTFKLNDFYNGNQLIEKEKFVNSVFKGVGGTLWGKIFKKEIIDKNNIRMNPDIFMCEDMIFVLEYVMKSKSFGAIEEGLYNYNRKNENSISSKINFNYFNCLISVMEHIERILNENGYEKEFIDYILCERIRSLAVSFSIMQHNKSHKYSKEEKLKNLNRIFENKYFKRYKDLFNGNNKSEENLIKLIKEENIKKVNSYSYNMFFVSESKRKIRKLISNGG